MENTQYNGTVYQGPITQGEGSSFIGGDNTNVHYSSSTLSPQQQEIQNLLNTFTDKICESNVEQARLEILETEVNQLKALLLAANPAEKKFDAIKLLARIEVLSAGLPHAMKIIENLQPAISQLLGFK